MHIIYMYMYMHMHMHMHMYMYMYVHTYPTDFEVGDVLCAVTRIFSRESMQVQMP